MKVNKVYYSIGEYLVETKEVAKKLQDYYRWSAGMGGSNEYPTYTEVTLLSEDEAKDLYNGLIKKNQWALSSVEYWK